MKFTVQTTGGAALSTSPAFAWNNYTTELMRIANNGNVGIGTTSPIQALDLGSGALRTGGLAISGTPVPLTSPFTVNGQTPSAFLFLDSTYSVLRFGTQSGGPTALIFDVAGGSGGDAITLSNTYLGPGYLHDNFISLGNSTTRYNSLWVGTGVSSFAGNVGIGTTSPNVARFGNSTVVTVLGSSAAGSKGVIELSTAQADANNLATGVLDYVFPAAASGYRELAQISAVTDGTTATQRGGDLVFATQTNGTAGASERMRITGSGNVGIGTTTPADLLEIHAGIARLSSTSDGNNGLIRFYDQTGAQRLQIGPSSPDSTAFFWAPSGTSFKFQPGGVESVRFTNTGNVGIGTTSPAAMLSIGTTSQFQVSSNGAISGTSLVLGGATLGTGALATLGTGGGQFTFDTSGAFNFGSGNLVSDPYGNVYTYESFRVSASSANPYMEIYDTFLYRDASQIFAQRNSTNAQNFRIYNTYTDASNYERGVFDWQTTPNVFRIGTEASGTGTLRNIALVGGNVGIGSTIPVSSLDLSQKNDALALPGGSNAQRPTGVSLVNGEIRYNTAGTGQIEAYYNGAWNSLVTSATAGTSTPAAGSTGQVQFNSGGDLAASSNFFWDNTNGRVGIGITSPAQNLVVQQNTSGGTTALTVANDSGGSGASAVLNLSTYRG
ncbi:MAG TPA: hypothetical protein VIE65_10370, partial [Methylobacter sp.]